ncbi:hypothetical protein DIPPA_21225 [Diplonema papillatum]|nr:hypothetical protein DIPPA_21225 [Diplonema papillatum]
MLFPDPFAEQAADPDQKSRISQVTHSTPCLRDRAVCGAVQRRFLPPLHCNDAVRGKTLPFTEVRPLKISEDRVASGVCFDELLAADLNTLLALGLSDDESREALHTVWAEVSRLRSALSTGWREPKVRFGGGSGSCL